MSESGGEAPTPITTPADPSPADEKNAVEETSAVAVDEHAAVGAVQSAGPDTDSDLRLFFGPNAEVFLSAIERRKAGRWFVGPCWPGFFFPAAWFLYRKFYGWAALCCIVPILATTLNFGEFGRALLVAPGLLGLQGRRLYVATAGTTIARIRASSQNEEEARETIRRAGGVSIAGAVLGGLLASIAIALAFIVGFRAGLNSVHPQRH
jgi:hypothetical protein